jgi:hypothetical protein
MRRKHTYLLLFIALSSTALAQLKPDFSGVWVPGDVKTSAAAGAGGAAALPPSDLTIHQSADTLSISRTAFDIVTTQTYKLDGSESTNKSGAVTRVTRSRWDGPSLVIEGKMSQVTSAGYAAWILKETYSLNSRGQLVLAAVYVSTDGTTTTSTQEFTKRGSKIRRPGL